MPYSYFLGVHDGEQDRTVEDKQCKKRKSETKQKTSKFLLSSHGNLSQHFHNNFYAFANKDKSEYYKGKKPH